MSGISIKRIGTGDQVSLQIDKINYNFDQLLQAGGGPPGPTGLPGKQGVPGADGPRGSLWTSGTSPSISSPKDGDQWLDPSGDVYTYQGGNFSFSGVNIRGPKGATGPAPAQLFQSYIGRKDGNSWIPDIGAKGQTGATSHPDFFALNAQESGSTKGPDTFIIGPVRDFESMDNIQGYNELPRVVVMQTNYDNGLMITQPGDASTTGGVQPSSNLRFDHASRFFVDEDWNLFIKTGYSSGGQLKKDIVLESTGRGIVYTPTSAMYAGASGYSNVGSDLLFSVPGNVGIDYEFPNNKLSLDGAISVGTNQSLDPSVSASFSDKVGIGLTGPNPILAVNGDASIGYNVQNNGNGALAVKDSVSIGESGFSSNFRLKVNGPSLFKDQIVVGANVFFGNNNTGITSEAYLEPIIGSTCQVTLQSDGDFSRVRGIGRSDLIFQGGYPDVAPVDGSQTYYRTIIKGGDGYTTQAGLNPSFTVNTDGSPVHIKGGDASAGSSVRGDVYIGGYDLNVGMDNDVSISMRRGEAIGDYDSDFALTVYNSTNVNFSGTFDTLSRNPRGLQVGEKFETSSPIPPDINSKVFQVNTPRGASDNDSSFSEVPKYFAIDAEGRMIYSPDAVGYGPNQHRRLVFWQENSDPTYGYPGQMLVSSKGSDELDFSQSSIEIKENINKLGNVLGKLTKVQLYSYNIKENDKGKFYGPIAEELEEIFPDAVNHLEDGASYHLPTFMSIVMKGLQELKEKVDKLEEASN